MSEYDILDKILELGIAILRIAVLGVSIFFLFTAFYGLISGFIRSVFGIGSPSMEGFVLVKEPEDLLPISKEKPVLLITQSMEQWGEPNYLKTFEDRILPKLSSKSSNNIVIAWSNVGWFRSNKLSYLLEEKGVSRRSCSLWQNKNVVQFRRLGVFEQYNSNRIIEVANEILGTYG